MCTLHPHPHLHTHTHKTPASSLIDTFVSLSRSFLLYLFLYFVKNHISSTWHGVGGGKKIFLPPFSIFFKRETAWVPTPLFLHSLERGVVGTVFSSKLYITNHYITCKKKKTKCLIIEYITPITKVLLSKTGSTRSQSKGSYSASLVFLTVDAFRPDGYSGYERIFFL